MKAEIPREQIRRLEQLPNIAKAGAADLRLIGIEHPEQLIGRDPYAMYEELCLATAQRHDPCVYDVFIAAVRFMEGGPALPWWAYTEERKAHLRRRGA